jgi:hypothetical protein
MRKLVWLLAVSGVVAFASPASAYSVFFEYFATVTSDVHSGSPPFSYTVLPENAVGTTFFIAENFESNPIQRADMPAFFATAYFVMVPSYTLYTQQSVQAYYGPTLDGFTSTIIGSSDLAASLAWLTFSNEGSNYAGNLFLTTQSYNRTLTFDIPASSVVAVGVVPLPPALPLFAFALLALGIFGYVRRANDATQPMVRRIKLRLKVETGG